MALTALADALGLIAANGVPQHCVSTPIESALGCILAEDIIARTSRPPLAVSAMDGYAVRLDDTHKAGTQLHIIGAAPAGRPFNGRVETGQAVRIFTGGAVPDGADHIVIQEDMVREGDIGTTTRNYSTREYVRPAGLDFRSGQRLIDAGTRLAAAELSLIAAANIASVEIFKPLRVGILANGDELRAPGSALAPGEIVNSNPIGLSALVHKWGGMPVDLGVTKDSVEAILSAIEMAPDIDVFVPVGGASVGEHDYMRRAFYDAGFAAIFEKVAVRPGKPTWFAERGDQRVLGLPGNPASAFVCAHLFLAPLLGVDFVSRPIPAILDVALEANGAREHFLRASVRHGPDGRLRVAPAANQDSSLLTPFIEANALIHRSPNTPALAASEQVDILPLRPVFER